VTVWIGAENLASTEVRSRDRPAPRDPLYRLCYPGPRCHSPYGRNLFCILFHDVDSAADCRV